MNAKVLLLVISLASAILYVTRHLVIYEVLCIISWTIATQRKKERDRELNLVPHGPSNEKMGETDTSLNPRAAPFQIHFQDSSNTSNATTSKDQTRKLIPVTGLCPVQNVKVMNTNGNFVEILAMLDSGSNTSLLFKNEARRPGLNGSATHLALNLAEKRGNLKRHRYFTLWLSRPQMRISRKPCKCTLSQDLAVMPKQLPKN